MLKYTGDQAQLQAFINFKDGPYSGGNCMTIKGSLRQNIIFSEQLYNGGLAMEDRSIHLFYSWIFFLSVLVMLHFFLALHSGKS